MPSERGYVCVRVPVLLQKRADESSGLSARTVGAHESREDEQVRTQPEMCANPNFRPDARRAARCIAISLLIRKEL